MRVLFSVLLSPWCQDLQHMHGASIYKRHKYFIDPNITFSPWIPHKVVDLILYLLSRCASTVPIGLFIDVICQPLAYRKLGSRGSLWHLRMPTSSLLQSYDILQYKVAVPGYVLRINQKPSTVQECTYEQQWNSYLWRWAVCCRHNFVGERSHSKSALRSIIGHSWLLLARIATRNRGPLQPCDEYQVGLLTICVPGGTPTQAANSMSKI